MTSKLTKVLESLAQGHELTTKTSDSKTVFGIQKNRKTDKYELRINQLRLTNLTAKDKVSDEQVEETLKEAVQLFEDTLGNIFTLAE